MKCSTPWFPVLHHLLDFAHTHVHWAGDAIQPSHPLSSPSPPAFSLSQHQGLFQWVCFSHQVARVLELQLQHQSFPWEFTVDFLWYWLVWSCCPRDSQESSPAPQLESISSSALSLLCPLSHLYMTTWKTIALSIYTFVGKVMSLPFNTLSRFVIAFLQSSKCLLISWLLSPSAVILEPKKINSVTVSIFSLLFAMKWWDWTQWS